VAHRRAPALIRRERDFVTTKPAFVPWPATGIGVSSLCRFDLESVHRRTVPATEQRRPTDEQCGRGPWAGSHIARCRHDLEVEGHRKCGNGRARTCGPTSLGQGYAPVRRSASREARKGEARKRSAPSHAALRTAALRLTRLRPGYGGPTKRFTRASGGGSQQRSADLTLRTSDCRRPRDQPPARVRQSAGAVRKGRKMEATNAPRTSDFGPRTS
jgi:hypothetical protein